MDASEEEKSFKTGVLSALIFMLTIFITICLFSQVAAPAVKKKRRAAAAGGGPGHGSAGGGGGGGASSASGGEWSRAHSGRNSGIGVGGAVGGGGGGGGAAMSAEAVGAPPSVRLRPRSPFSPYSSGGSGSGSGFGGGSAARRSLPSRGGVAQ